MAFRIFDRPALVFHFDWQELHAEIVTLELASQQQRELAEARATAELLMSNLQTALPHVAAEAIRAFGQSPGVEQEVTEAVLASISLTLEMVWRGIWNAGPSFRTFTTVDSAALERHFSHRKSYAVTPPPLGEMRVFQCDFELLTELEVAGRPPVRHGRLWVPTAALPSDTIRHLHQRLPMAPSSEILDVVWLRSFVPGLVRAHVWRCSRNGERLIDRLSTFSLSINDYVHMGLP